MKQLTLSAHCKPLEGVQLCESCQLLWFGARSVGRLSGQAIIDLLPLMLNAIKTEPAATVSDRFECPECNCLLRPVSNLGRFGRFKQLGCSNESCNGYSQTFMSWLAEKGFVRQMRWLDVQQWLKKGAHVVCTSCGADLDNRPQQTCPYCQSPIAVLDPAGFNSAMDIHQAAASDTLPIRLLQNRCHSCGGPVDHVRDVSCPHCTALVTNVDKGAMQLITAGLADVMSKSQQQQTDRPQAELEDRDAMPNLRYGSKGHYLDYLGPGMEVKIALCIGILAIAIILQILHSSRTTSSSPATWQGISHSVTAVSAPDVEPLAKDASPLKEAAAELTSVSREPAFSGTPSLSQMYSFPEMECAADSERRTAVRVRQIIITPDTEGAARPLDAEDMRRAWRKLDRVRTRLQSGADFSALQRRHSNRQYAAETSGATWRHRSARPDSVERVAFCLSRGAVSPIIRSQNGFHVLQVLESRTKG